jgi:hypothetical protein
MDKQNIQESNEAQELYYNFGASELNELSQIKEYGLNHNLNVRLNSKDYLNLGVDDVTPLYS